jgi:hypothetical protein
MEGPFVLMDLIVVIDHDLVQSPGDDCYPKRPCIAEKLGQHSAEEAHNTFLRQHIPNTPENFGNR